MSELVEQLILATVVDMIFYSDRFFTVGREVLVAGNEVLRHYCV